MTDDPECVDLPTRTRDLFNDGLLWLLAAWGPPLAEHELPGDRIGWSVDIWEHDGDAVWRITVEAVGS